jgi:hypothetical protein
MLKMCPQANGCNSASSKGHTNTNSQHVLLRRAQARQLFQGDALDWDQDDRDQARKAHACRTCAPRLMDVSQHLPIDTQRRIASICFIETDASSATLYTETQSIGTRIIDVA